MALVLDTTYNNVFYKNVLAKLRDLISADRDYGDIYISPTYEDKGSYSVRLWGSGAETDHITTPTEWTKAYSVDVAMYSIEQSPDESYWEQFLADGERLYQIMANNINVSGSLGWFDGMVGEMRVEDLEEDEEGIDGLHTIKYDFVCRISRAD